MIVVAVVALIMIIGLTSLLAGNGQASLPEPTHTRLVRTASARLQDGSEFLRLPGVLQAADQANLAFLHAGQLAERQVKRGQQVAAGELLALLHNPSLSPGLAASEASLREAGTQLAQAERELRRIVDLHERALVSTEELERTEARRDALEDALDQAEARRREASEQLAEASLRAPFAGTIVDLHVETGEFIAAGQAVMTLVGNGALEIELDLGPARAARLEIDQLAKVLGPDGHDAHAARVSEIGLAGSGKPARVRLTVDQAPAHWRPGLGVQVELEFPALDRLSVPLAAVLDAGAGQPRLFRVENGRAILVPVELGRIQAGRVIVNGALTDGDTVIIAGHGQLLDDETVQVLP
jgi:RND family efflux transporter MFP subunit